MDSDSARLASWSQDRSSPLPSPGPSSSPVTPVTGAYAPTCFLPRGQLTSALTGRRRTRSISCTSAAVQGLRLKGILATSLSASSNNMLRDIPRDVTVRQHADAGTGSSSTSSSPSGDGGGMGSQGRRDCAPAPVSNIDTVSAPSSPGRGTSSEHGVAQRREGGGISPQAPVFGENPVPEFPRHISSWGGHLEHNQEVSESGQEEFGFLASCLRPTISCSTSHGAASCQSEEDPEASRLLAYQSIRQAWLADVAGPSAESEERPSSGSASYHSAEQGDGSDGEESPTRSEGTLTMEPHPLGMPQPVGLTHPVGTPPSQRQECAHNPSRQEATGDKDSQRWGTAPSKGSPAEQPEGTTIGPNCRSGAACSIGGNPGRLIWEPGQHPLQPVVPVEVGPASPVAEDEAVAEHNRGTIIEQHEHDDHRAARSLEHDGGCGDLWSMSVPILSPAHAHTPTGTQPLAFSSYGPLWTRLLERRTKRPSTPRSRQAVGLGNGTTAGKGAPQDWPFNTVADNDAGTGRSTPKEMTLTSSLEKADQNLTRSSVTVQGEVKAPTGFARGMSLKLGPSVEGAWEREVPPEQRGFIRSMSSRLSRGRAVPRSASSRKFGGSFADAALPQSNQEGVAGGQEEGSLDTQTMKTTEKEIETGAEDGVQAEKAPLTSAPQARGHIGHGMYRHAMPRADYTQGFLAVREAFRTAAGRVKGYNVSKGFSKFPDNSAVTSESSEQGMLAMVPCKSSDDELFELDLQTGRAIG